MKILYSKNFKDFNIFYSVNDDSRGLIFVDGTAYNDFIILSGGILEFVVDTSKFYINRVSNPLSGQSFSIKEFSITLDALILIGTEAADAIANCQ